MAIRLSILCSVILLSCGLAAGFPCSKYVFEFGGGTAFATQGDLTVAWKINTGLNGCSIDSASAVGKEFIVRIRTFYNDLLLEDTTQQSHYRFPSSIGNGHCLILFDLQEVDDLNSVYTMGIRLLANQEMQSANKIDSLNHYLWDGYFLNATHIIYELDDTKLLKQVTNAYHELFPENYPDKKDFFNCYVDSVSMDLKRMPFVDGMDSFIKEINRLTKEEFTKSQGFKIEAKISKDGELMTYEVYPSDYRDEFEQAKDLLSFTANDSKDQLLLISIGRSKNSRKYEIVNSRALLNPDSKKYEKRFRYRGAVN